MSLIRLIFLKKRVTVDLCNIILKIIWKKLVEIAHFPAHFLHVETEAHFGELRVTYHLALSKTGVNRVLSETSQAIKNTCHMIPLFKIHEQGGP